jgi:hypothetical protein
MRVAQIEGGVVTNVLLINPARVPDHLKDMPEAPDHVGVGWTYDGEFHAPASAIAADDVKAEASRRILDLCPEWKQRNLTAQAAILAAKGRDNWTDEEQAAWDAGEALWEQISTIRAASDQIEAMDPIPQDFTDDKYWG